MYFEQIRFSLDLAEPILITTSLRQNEASDWPDSLTLPSQSIGDVSVKLGID